MKFGLFYEHQLPRPWSETGEFELLQNSLTQVELADRLGYDYAWEVEHHFLEEYSHSSAPEVFLAAASQRTKQIRMAHGIIQLTTNHPARVAERVSTLDLISGGRVEFGIGEGSSITELHPFDRRFRDKRDVWEDAVKALIPMFADEASEYHGKYFDFLLRNVLPKPFQKPHPPIAISLMSPSSATAKLAGEHGWIPISGGSFVQSRYIASHWTKYVEGCAVAGRRPDPSIWRVCRSIIVTDSDQEAEDHVMDPDGPFQFWFRYLESTFKRRKAMHLFRPDGREQDETVTWQDVARSQVAYGSPNTVLDKLVWLRERVGDFGVLIQTAHEWTDPAFGRRSMIKLAEEVMPRLAQHAQATRAGE